MVLNLATVTREELKKDIAEAMMNGDMLAAQIRFGFWGELITEEGFQSVDEINEYYLIKPLFKGGLA